MSGAWNKVLVAPLPVSWCLVFTVGNYLLVCGGIKVEDASFPYLPLFFLRGSSNTQVEDLPPSCKERDNIGKEGVIY